MRPSAQVFYGNGQPFGALVMLLFFFFFFMGTSTFISVSYQVQEIVYPLSGFL